MAPPKILQPKTILLNIAATSFVVGEPPLPNKIQRRISDKSQNGLSDFHRLYQTSDGWIYVSAEDPVSGDALLDVVGLTNCDRNSPRHEHSGLGFSGRRGNKAP